MFAAAVYVLLVGLKIVMPPPLPLAAVTLVLDGIEPPVIFEVQKSMLCPLV